VTESITEVVDDVYDVTIATRYDRRYRVFMTEYGMPTLFDAGFEDTTDTLIKRLDALGVVPERLVITHSDPDHIGGLGVLKRRYGLDVWVPENADHEAADLADNRYGDGDRIGRFEAVHVPGHTADSSALVDERRGIAVMGDTVYGSDARGLPPEYPIAPAAGLTENPHDAERNLEALLGYDFDVALVYHGSSITDGASEKLAAYVHYPGHELAHY